MFLSYRRSDSSHIAGRLADQLVDNFGPANVFMDVDFLDPGVDHAGAIDRVIASCDVLLALIGRQWLRAADDLGRRRLDDPDDVVALEISSALRRGITVIPVLVDGTPLPRAAELPPHLVPLVRINAASIGHETFRADLQRLVDAIRWRSGEAAVTGSAVTDEPVAPYLAAEVPAGHLFVSYAREDQARVQPLIDLLGRRYRLWIDTASTLGGGDWSLQIIDAIKTSRALLLMLSERSMRSDAVRKEVLYAEKRKIKIIPILTEPLVELPDWYSFHFEYLHRIPAFGRSGAEQATADIQKAVGPR